MLDSLDPSLVAFSQECCRHRTDPRQTLEKHLGARAENPPRVLTLCGSDFPPYQWIGIHVQNSTFFGAPEGWRRMLCTSQRLKFSTSTSSIDARDGFDRSCCTRWA